MSVEFFVPDWLRARPVVYLLSHMPILLFIDTYITACDWLVAGNGPPPALILFLAVSFFNGLVLEFGRKLRAPSDEETGVETYSSIWGIKTASSWWLACLGTAAALALATLHALNLPLGMGAALGAMIFLGTASYVAFNKFPTSKKAKWLEAISSAWVLAVYLSLGTIPAITRSVCACLH
jgi:4-hydroxybenzoate polyprenyltransferase